MIKGSRRRIVTYCGVLLLTVLAGAALISYWRSVRLERKLTDARAAFLKSTKALIRPGMRRSQAEALLGERKITFEQHTNQGPIYNDYILIDRSSSSLWYCSFLDSSVEIVFKAGGEYHGGRQQPDDVVTVVAPYEQLMDCL